MKLHIFQFNGQNYTNNKWLYIISITLLGSKFKFLLVQGRALKQSEDLMQCFPSNWKDEFSLISDLGFYGIEWIYDKKSEEDNPILSEVGREQMIELSQIYNVSLENIILDWFIFHPILVEDQLTIEKKIDRLCLLINESAKTGFKRIVLPLLEQNNISSHYKKNRFIKIFNKNISKHLDLHDIELHLETTLPPNEEYQLLKDLNHDKVRICFDMGNSASEDFEPHTAISTIRDFLGSVHIKDRKLHGVSVPLGTGVVRFHDVFSALKEVNFSGPYSFQIYRNKESDNIVLLKDSLTFINNVITQIYNE